MQDKIWIHRDIPQSEINSLSNEAGISRLLAKVFASRGVTDAGYVREFLNPNLQGFHDPFLLKDMDIAVCRIIQAIGCGEHIVIFGDYDVDGVTGTSILYNFLTCCGANPEYYIPDRMDEGYGLSIDAINRIAQTGASLLITVDCGITAVVEVDHINSLNMQVIITDHHECKELLPTALAVVNPCRSDCEYPFRELAGAGVVFKLVQALCLKMGIGDVYLQYLDLAALGTIADIVPLIDENRIIAKYGLSAIEKSVNPGIKAVIDIAGLKDKPVTTYGVGFTIAPRINAAGRMGSAMRAVKLFTTEDRKLADEIAVELNEENRCRQEAETDIIQQVITYVEAMIDLETEKVIVVSGKAWHHGIIGIVASKIVERYHRPCILLCDDNGYCKGSGRSIEGFSLFKALMYCQGLLEKFGGHEMAAGLALKTEDLDCFKRMVNEYADSILTADDLVPHLKIDANADLEDMTLENIKELDLLAPYGSGNPCPVFVYNGFKIGEIRTVGENRHLKLRLNGGGMNIDAIGFNMGELSERYTAYDVCDSVFNLEINIWNNTAKVQLNLKDIRPHKFIVFDESNDYNGNIPVRADLAAVYQYLKALCRNLPVYRFETRLAVDDVFSFSGNIAEKYKVCMNYSKFIKCIDIFEELRLLKKEMLGENSMVITVFDVVNKVNLDDSTIYKKLCENEGQAYGA